MKSKRISRALANGKPGSSIHSTAQHRRDTTANRETERGVSLERSVSFYGKRTTHRPKDHYGGSRDLAEFAAAPESTQRAFWQRLGAEIESERESEEWLSETTGLPLRSIAHVTETQWGRSWRRRARAVRRAALAPEDDWTPSRDEDPLVDIPTRTYVEALTGEEVPRSGAMRCVLPDHVDRNPSFRAYEGNGWRCFGCGRSGSIYDLAAALWDIEPRGQGFREIHRRLRRVFA